MKGIIFVIAACFCWAIDSLIRYPLVGEGVSAYKIVLIENFFLTLIFSYFFLKKITRIKSDSLLSFIFIGAIGSALATLAFTKAFEILNPSLVIVLQKFQPVVAIFLARFLLKEELKSDYLLWAIVCLFGGFLIGYKDISKIFDTSIYEVSRSTIMGYTLVAFSVIGWGASTVFGKKLTIKGFNTQEIVGGRAFFAFICLIPFILDGQISKGLETSHIGKIAMIAFLSGGLGLYLYYQGLKRIPARLCALVEMFYPVAAIIANWIFLGFSISWLEAIGATILMGGSFMIQDRKY